MHKLTSTETNWHQQNSTTSPDPPRCCLRVAESACWRQLVSIGTGLKDKIFSPGHTETPKYQNVHIYPEQKWLGFAMFSLFSVCQREIKKHTHLDHPVPMILTVVPVPHPYPFTCTNGHRCTVVDVSWRYAVALVETWNLGPRSWGIGKSNTGEQFSAVNTSLMK